MSVTERTAHTPGPLQVKSRLVRWGANGEKSATRWAVLRQEDGSEVGVARKRGDADLWAAAPEMMEALEDAKRVIELVYPSSGYSDVPEVTLEKISAVLDKARGGGE